MRAVWKETLTFWCQRAGLAIKYAFSNVGCYFSLLSVHKDNDLYFTTNYNNVGGPSIIFNREKEIKNEDSTCRDGEARKSSERLQESGWYDSNILYPWAITQPMATGNYSRLVAVMVLRYKTVLVWQLTGRRGRAHQCAIHNCHQYRRLPADWFCSRTLTAFQFHCK